ncbi:uncharacterized protein LOC129798827 [Phlebotomus papatasi]|uniref:uncharacterized protein LOC129798827 n=1 Tax=Phlebotomus papatasi TaxID=29031 RepID=UPI002483F1F9|nr:uncharacterized protein LOC129798827 [Phlebotomus papatasi]
MSFCSICNTKVAREDLSKISCSVCLSKFHLSCLKFTGDELKAVKASAATWKCAQCMTKERRISTGSSASSVGAKKVGTAKNSSLDEFRRVFEVKMSEMTENNGKTTKVLDKISCLIEQLKVDTNQLKKDAAVLKTKTEYCESRVKAQDRMSELCSVEILDVPADLKGDIYSNASHMLTTALNIDIPEEAIADCHVINLSKKKARNKSGDNVNQGNIWIVRLLCKRTRDRILTNVRQRGRDGSWKLNCKTMEGRDCCVRVKERVSTYTRELYKNARGAAADNGWKYVWIRDGRVFVRKKEEDRVSVVNSSTDLLKLIDEH